MKISCILPDNASDAALRVQLADLLTSNPISDPRGCRVLPAYRHERQPRQNPDDWSARVQSIAGDSRRCYIERVAQLALFYFELAEEGCNAHSKAVLAQLPMPVSDWQTVQALFRCEWYGVRRMTLTGAALAFHAWLLNHGAAGAQLAGAETGIRSVCHPYERRFTAEPCLQRHKQRSYVRMARYFRHMLREQTTSHSRAVQWFLADAMVPQSVRQIGQHPEHAVPCAVLRDVATACFRDQWPVHQVAKLLERLLVVIWIDQCGRALLDEGPANLRSVMPPAWHYKDSCIYARLHDKGIIFHPAPGHPCTCGMSR